MFTISLEYPVSKSEEHSQEVDKLLPEDNSNSPIVEAARILWKKWIVLKMVFKIPKLERPKDGKIINLNKMLFNLFIHHRRYICYAQYCKLVFYNCLFFILLKFRDLFLFKNVIVQF